MNPEMGSSIDTNSSITIEGRHSLQDSLYMTIGAVRKDPGVHLQFTLISHEKECPLLMDNACYALIEIQLCYHVRFNLKVSPYYVRWLDSTLSPYKVRACGESRWRRRQ